MVAKDYMLFAAAGATLCGLICAWQRRRPSRPSRTKARIEKSISLNSCVVARLRGTRPQYVYGVCCDTDPFLVQTLSGAQFGTAELEWVGLAQDNGWLEPQGLEWQEPGRLVILRLLKDDEWISAKVSNDMHRQNPSDGHVKLRLDGLQKLEEIDIERDVAFLFTPHNSAVSTFSNSDWKPKRGGKLVEHLSTMFVSDDTKQAMRLRWVQQCRVEPQYPMRCVWCHASVKEKAVQEFVNRSLMKVEQNLCRPPAPEIVLLLGPPAAGKSSISRLPPEELPQELRATAASLPYREEVNNDNLTDCMPGFREEFRVALGIPKETEKGGAMWQKMKRVVKKKEMSFVWAAHDLQLVNKAKQSAMAWAMQWLTYAMFHHGPVRDSLAWDIIKITVVDAAEVPVYYSSVMAGAAIDRTMHIIELAQNKHRPVPHPYVRSVSFWPYASQEARSLRQKNRHREEKQRKQLLGGNVDANLVNLHFHAQQAEANISKMIDCLWRGVKPTDGTSSSEQKTNLRVDNFIVIDNDGEKPRLLLDLTRQCKQRKDQQAKEVSVAALDILEIIKQLDPCMLSKDLYRICKFHLPADSPTNAAALQSVQDVLGEDLPPCALEDLLSHLAEADEAIFLLLNPDTSAIATDALRKSSSRTFDASSRATLSNLEPEKLKLLKERISDVRMFSVVALLRDATAQEQAAVESDSEDD